jgi:hypothetical protein
MECRDVRELADSFLSEQLLVETNHELLRHLDTCPDCRADIAGRRAMRDGLRAAFARAEDLRPRPEFAAELRATLRTSRPGSRGVRYCSRGGRSRRASPLRPEADCSSATRMRDRAWPRWRVRQPAIIRTAPSHSVSPSDRSLWKTPASGMVGRTPRSPRSSRWRSTDRSSVGPTRLRVPGPPLRPRGLSLPRRADLIARHGRGAANGSRTGAQRRRPSRGLAAGGTLPRVRRRRSRSAARPAPGGDTRTAAVATPRLDGSGA